MFDWLFTSSETPLPAPTMTVDPEAVSPGAIGYFATVILVIFLVLLVWDMNRRVRRVRYRSEVRDALDAEEAESARTDDGLSVPKETSDRRDTHRSRDPHGPGDDPS